MSSSLLFACTDSSTSPGLASPATAAPAIGVASTCDPNNGSLKLPAGFCARVFAEGVFNARQIAVTPHGDLYVAVDTVPNPGVRGGIVALRDANGDGRAEVRQFFGSTGGNGIAWRNGQLFFASETQVVRWDLPSGTLLPPQMETVVVAGLTGGGDHHRKTVVVDGSDNLFVNIGSATNSCQVVNRTDFSPGVDPCPELAVRAGVWRFSASGSGQVQSVAARYATELRNMNALAIDPGNGMLYGVQNGRDQLFDNWPNLYDAQDDALLPSEELFRIEAGKRYGWPYCYHDAQRQAKILSPEYGGNAIRVGRCETREKPLATYPAHWAPLSILFYTGTQFPTAYQGGLFIAFHGSRFDASQQPAGPGYIVAFVPWANGAPTGGYQTFADGLIGAGRTPLTARHRAVGLAQGPDGSLYISDDKGGFIWRVFYTGSGSTSP
ncbi:MAG: PQQ-dependent sugar dehydrogenase [Cytophagaceae bacterium]|nr:PQQ-dependent sugar dehydrogenase [Gemmatimonadaceae bacterium]